MEELSVTGFEVNGPDLGILAGRGMPNLKNRHFSAGKHSGIRVYRLPLPLD